jgi:branched-chain amino acid transport system ATP-binding protein
MLAVDDMHTFYGVSHVLQGVSRAIDTGENVCLIGRNGAGKTTTLKSIIGLVPPKLGSVKFRGEEVSGMRPHSIARRGIGYVPEERRIFPNLTVKDNLEIARNRMRHATFASLVADRGYVMDKGTITYRGAVDELRNNQDVKDRYLSV